MSKQPVVGNMGPAIEILAPVVSEPVAPVEHQSAVVTFDLRICFDNVQIM